MKTEEGLPSAKELLENFVLDAIAASEGPPRANLAIQTMKAYAEQVRNETLRIAAEEARTKQVKAGAGYITVVDKESILSLEDDQRLQIR